LRNGQRCVVGRDLAPTLLIQRLRDAGHGVVGTQAGGVVFHLFLQIAGVETRQTRRRHAVSAAVQTVAGETGVRRTARAAAHGDDLAIGREGAIRLARRGIAGGQAGQQDKGEKRRAHDGATPAYGGGSALD